MTQVPANWTTQVSDWVDTPVGAAGDFFMVEQVDDNGPNPIRLSLNQPSGASMTFGTTWDVINTGTKYIDMFKSIIGGWCQRDTVRYPPMNHPNIPALLAKDVMNIRGVTLDGDNSDVFGAYNVALFDVSFETLPYVTSGCNAWMEFSGRAANQRLSVPVGWYEFKSGTPHAGRAANFGTYYTQQFSYTSVVAHQCPDSLLFPSYPNIVCDGATKVGFVNNDQIWSMPAGYLLLDSIEYEPYGAWDDPTVQIYDVNFNFIYNNQGWNTAIDTDGNFYQIVFADGSAKPIQLVDFVPLFTDLGLDPCGQEDDDE